MAGALVGALRGLADSRPLVRQHGERQVLRTLWPDSRRRRPPRVLPFLHPGRPARWHDNIENDVHGRDEIVALAQRLAGLDIRPQGYTPRFRMDAAAFTSTMNVACVSRILVSSQATSSGKVDRAGSLPRKNMNPCKVCVATPQAVQSGVEIVFTLHEDYVPSG